MEEKPTIGQQLAAMRKVKQRLCAFCREPLTTIGPKRYCSNACRQKAYYQRRKEKPGGDSDPV